MSATVAPNAYDASIAERREQILHRIETDLSPVGRVVQIVGEIIPLQGRVLFEGVHVRVYNEGFVEPFRVGVRWNGEKETLEYGSRDMPYLPSDSYAPFDAHSCASAQKTMANIADAMKEEHQQRVGSGVERAEQDLEFHRKRLKREKIGADASTMFGLSTIPSMVSMTAVDMVSMPVTLGVFAVMGTWSGITHMRAGAAKQNVRNAEKLIEQPQTDSTQEYGDLYRMIPDVSEKAVFINHLDQQCALRGLTFEGEPMVTGPDCEEWESHLKEHMVTFYARTKTDDRVRMLFDGKNLFYAETRESGGYIDVNRILPV